MKQTFTVLQSHDSRVKAKEINNTQTLPSRSYHLVREEKSRIDQQTQDIDGVEQRENRKEEERKKWREDRLTSYRLGHTSGCQ